MSLTTALRRVRAPPTFLAPCLAQQQQQHLQAAAIRGQSSSQRRLAHSGGDSSPRAATQVPSPTAFVPDVATFLSVIGRSMSQHAAKFGSWAELFGASSAQLRELGVEPARARRYLLWWRERFRRGEYGIAGDATRVHDGVVEVAVRREPGPAGRRVAVNVTPSAGSAGATATYASEDLTDAVPLRGVSVTGPLPGTIVGPHFQAVPGSRGSIARIRAAEGIWEVKRGRKIHGGERRRKNVLSRIAARARGTLT